MEMTHAIRVASELIVIGDKIERILRVRLTGRGKQQVKVRWTSSAKEWVNYRDLGDDLWKARARSMFESKYGI
jgi:hypothetical protein